MILGFDNDDHTIFDAQRQFITEARIVLTMIGMLYAAPKTPLHDRLARENRIDWSDESEFGTNIIPLRISREALRDGYVKVLNELYEPNAFFGRLDDLYLRAKIEYGLSQERYWRQYPWKYLKAKVRLTVQAIGLFARLMGGVPEAPLRKEYRKRVWKLLRTRRNPMIVRGYLIYCAIHYHDYTMARHIASGKTRVFNSA